MATARIEIRTRVAPWLLDMLEDLTAQAAELPLSDVEADTLCKLALRAGLRLYAAGQRVPLDPRGVRLATAPSAWPEKRSIP